MAKPDDPRLELTRFRRQIDALDLKLLKVLNDRAGVAQKIGAVKRRHGLAVIEPAREQQVVANMLSANTGPLPNDSIERIFLGVMIEMRNIQRDHQPAEPLPPPPENKNKKEE
jgi:chorismate mutase-like protein